MDRLRTVGFGIRRNTLLLAGVFLSLYFSYHMVYGGRSFENLAELQAVTAQRQGELVQVRAEREALEGRVRLLRPSSLSLDMLEEQVRLILAYKRADEVFVVDGN